MKIIQKLGIIAIALIFTFNLAQAQRGERLSVEERVERQTEKLTEHLDLDPNQKTQVQAIHMKYAQQREELRGERTEANRDAMKAMRKAEKIELEAVLTEEQIAKLATLKKESRGKKGGKGKKEKNG